jgi:aminoglycoside phosphotransferase (APT) family kinase protein
VDLPPFPPLGDTLLQMIAESVGATTWRRLPEMGIFNAMVALDNKFVLRFPRSAPEFIEALEKEAVAIPQVRLAGVLTPAIVTFDNSHQRLGVPYMVLEYVHGKTLAALGLEPEQVPETWREVGRQLAQLHQGVQVTPENQNLRSFSLPSAKVLNQQRVAEGYYTSSEGKWLEAWLNHLASFRADEVRIAFCHGDLQTTNLMVNDAGEFVALIDWGAAGWTDPAHDFAGIPLRALPFMLGGYETVLRNQGQTFKARVLERHIQLALFLVNRPPAPHHSWAERPLGMLLEIMRFVISLPRDWRELVVT